MYRRSLLIGSALFGLSFGTTLLLKKPKAKESIAYTYSPQPPPEPLPPAKPELITVGKSVHYKYAEAPEAELEYVGDFGSRKERLHRDAAPYFHSMIAAAATQGVTLSVVSGFRSYDTQKALWENQIKRRGTEAAAAVWSAPPGYSEHHTGYAMDFNGDNPSTVLSESFSDTSVYRWLSENAAQFGFYISFPKDNSQNIGYEPWHWRWKPNVIG